MIPIDKDILQEIQKEYPYVKRQDIDFHINDVYPNGQPTSIDLHEGEFETTSFHSLKRICYNPKGKIIDDREPLYHRSDNSIYGFFDDIPLNTLQDEIELFHIRAMRFASEHQLKSINLFRYRWMRLLDRIPPMFDVLPLLPKKSTTDEPNLYYELRSADQRKKWSKKFKEFEELSDTLDKERRQPIGCPPLKTTKTWNKQIYLLVQDYYDKYWGKKWVDSELMNICKYLALKYKIDGEWKHPQQILNSYSQAKIRPSKLNND